MDTEDSRRFIYVPQGVPLKEFIEFWAPRYHDAHENLYTSNIRRPHTNETLRDLFYWKEGPQFFKKKWPAINDNFVSRREQAEDLPSTISAQDFLATFPRGGRIYRIFWLHCWFPNRFPIYDQHVHRAMSYIQDGEAEELENYGDDEAVKSYIDRYIPFHQPYAAIRLPFDPRLDGIPSRKADRALFVFGRSLLTSGMPPLKSVE
jgi:hypothetical protein